MSASEHLLGNMNACPLTARCCALLLAACACHASTLRADDASPVSFRYDVLPALSKQGCSAGACHGSPSGKGGFRLSLRGFDPELDRLTLARESARRRVNTFEPADSLLLLKPAMRVPHGGGLRLRKGDSAYRILLDWIARGCPEDPAGSPLCTHIELDPPKCELLWPDDHRQFRVRASFSDGAIRDITHLTTFLSSDDRVATVDAAGKVSALARGEATIVARYLDFVETAELRFLKPIQEPEIAWHAPAENNYIDQLVFARLKMLQIQPSPLCSDSEFLRRVYLDVLGILPTREQCESFLEESSTDKRASPSRYPDGRAKLLLSRRRLIDHLLEREEHAEFWAQKWGDLLRVKESKLGIAGVHKFHRWLLDAVRDNMTYDRFATELLTAQGSTLGNPPAGFYRAAADPNDCAESAAQLFLGIRIQCAKCHNHPFDRWSQDNYYGLGAFFVRVRRRPTNAPDEVLVWLDRESEIIQPRTGRQLKPWLPLAGEVEAGSADRRELLARWLVSPDNPFFARVGVNRIWAHLCGRGIVEPVDDFRADNPPAHADLLDALAREFVENGYDQKEIIRTILNSRVYQLSSKTNASNERDEKYFSHSRARLLGAEQLLDAICQATGVPERFVNLPPGTRATGLPSPDYGSDFLKVFGQPQRNTVCECERGDDPRLAQALQLVNGPLISRKLRDSRGRLARLLDDVDARVAAAGKPPDDGLAAWFKADTGAVSATGDAADDGDRVRRWENQLNHRQGATQEDGEMRPAFAASSIGGLPALRFDGQDDFLHNTKDRLLAAGSPRTVVVVARLLGDSGGALFTFGRARLNGSSVFTAQHVLTGGSYYVYSDGVNGDGNTTAPIERLASLRQPFVTSFVSPGQGHKLQVRVNGVDLPTEQSGSVGPDHGVAGFTIGSREDIPPADQIWNGDISEVLVYDRALDDEQLAAVGSYLATKYDLATAHPRKPQPVATGVSDRELVTDFYFAALSRPPAEDEIQAALNHISSCQQRRRGLEDVAWALMNSKEFVFQH